ncbi:MAG: hypothetical protein K1W33_06780 [Clostridia bacterium]
MKLKNKEKKFCGGKLVVTDFKRLNPEEGLFLGEESPEQFCKELAAYSVDGKVYINAKINGSDIVAGIFQNLIPESKDSLWQYQEEYGKKFPHIKTFTDWESWAQKETDNEKIVHALVVLMIPLEMKRRSIESSYYGKIRAFPSQF